MGAVIPGQMRWKDPRGVVHRVVRVAEAALRYMHTPGVYWPRCRMFDRTFAWGHPKRCRKPIDCMACIAFGDA